MPSRLLKLFHPNIRPFVEHILESNDRDLQRFRVERKSLFSGMAPSRRDPDPLPDRFTILMDYAGTEIPCRVIMNARRLTDLDLVFPGSNFLQATNEEEIEEVERVLALWDPEVPESLSHMIILALKLFRMHYVNEIAKDPDLVSIVDILETLKADGILEAFEIAKNCNHTKLYISMDVKSIYSEEDLDLLSFSQDEEDRVTFALELKLIVDIGSFSVDEEKAKISAGLAQFLDDTLAIGKVRKVRDIKEHVQTVYETINQTLDEYVERGKDRMKYMLLLGTEMPEGALVDMDGRSFYYAEMCVVVGERALITVDVKLPEEFPDVFPFFEVEATDEESTVKFKENAFYEEDITIEGMIEDFTSTGLQKLVQKSMEKLNYSPFSLEDT